MTASPTLVILSPPTLNPSAVDVNVVVFVPLPIVAVVAVTAVKIGASANRILTVSPEVSVRIFLLEAASVVANPPSIFSV